MLKNKYDLILFDLDGTVADTDEVIVQSLFKMYDLYRNGNRSPREKVVYFSGPPMRETLKAEFPGGDNDFLFSEFIRISWDYYYEYAKCFPHCKEVLLKLKENGIKIGVVTGKQRDCAEHCIRVIGLENVFDYLLGADEIKTVKPDPEGINKGIEHFNIKDKRKVLYVGDNLNDYKAAKNAGVDVAMVTWGPRQLAEPISPTYWINDFLDLEGDVYE